MISLLLSEWLKSKRTGIRWLGFLLPPLFSLAVAGYIVLRGQLSETEIFQLFFFSWEGLMVPIMTGILAASLVQEEAFAGNFTGYLTRSIDRKKLYFSKYLFLLLFHFVSAILAFFVFQLTMQIVSPDAVKGWVIFALALIFGLFGALPLLAIHLWASFVWGTGISIGIGIGGLISSMALGTSVLADRVWVLMPWLWPYRMAGLPGAYLKFTAGMDRPPVEIASGAVARQFLTGNLVLLISLVIFCAGGMVWFNSWEGRKSQE